MIPGSQEMIEQASADLLSSRTRPSTSTDGSGTSTDGTASDRNVAIVALTIVLSITSFTGAGAAVGTHGAWDNSVRYRDYPCPPAGRRRAIVAADSMEGRAYLYNFPSQQYAMAPLGWRFDVVDVQSDQLVANVPDEVGMVVLRHAAGAPDGAWSHMAPYNIVVWVRLSSVSSRQVGGICDSTAPG